jgi:hypothetical protein
MRKVFVYWNLHRDCWSVKALDGELKGKVIYHAQEIPLWECEFKVSEAGRQRVLREKCKNVHAGVVGYMQDDMLAPAFKLGRRVTYNPYKYDSFVDAQTLEPVRRSDFASLTDTRAVFAWSN